MKELEHVQRILFAGGGTAGPVTPLLAVHNKMKELHTQYYYHWVGTKNGPERGLVAKQNIAFTSIATVKLDRFLSLRNLSMPFKFLFACIQAYRLLRNFHPDIIVSAGGFVSVPVIWMAKLMGIPSMIHQLDIRPGLANKLCAPFANTITVTFEQSLSAFPSHKAFLIGAPVRDDITQPSTHSIPVNDTKPVILVFGGGTGAKGINDLLLVAIDEILPYAQIIHITGAGKFESLSRPGYHPYEFLKEEMAEAYSKADLVISRSGIGTITELSRLKKAAIILPLPKSHQWDNAHFLIEKDAALVLDQEKLNPLLFAEEIIKLLKNKEKCNLLSQNIGALYNPYATIQLVEKIEDILYNRKSNQIELN